ncbi:ABC transporter permease [Pelagibacterium lentulum]|uniref:Sugar ABC transporter permease n=1 Tax=Pelagibacterium lentulum TaxID=2029865 RepID=A0A916VVL6_9HYPH|nr:ABC transporter permease [Pelagibacterium lentulum]GGA41005.1 sugar ABC transporter permease [Pelagibacterium lentulum]
MILWRRIRPFLSTFVRFMHISFLEAKSGYQGTRLGLLWLPFSTLIFTGMLTLVFRHSDTMPIADFFLYVLSGYTLWQFIQGSINGSIDIIQKRLEFAIHNNLTLAGLFSKLLVDRLFEYSVNLGVLIVAIVVLRPGYVGWDLFLFAPFIAIIVPTSLAISYLINIITVFFPDMATLIRTATRFLFFASPIFWIASEGTGVRQFLSQYNPVAYFLGMVRQVFGVTPIEASAWIGSIAVSLVVCGVGYVAFSRSKGFVRNIK